MTQNNVPKLRFKEFSGEWEETTLGEVATIIGGGTPDTTKASYWNGYINWFTPTEIKEKYISHSNRKITKLGLENSSAKVLPEGALLFSSRATVGDVSIALNECTTNQGFQSFVTKDDVYNEFLYYWITSHKNLFLTKASGSTFLEISKTEISNIQISIPSLPEQTKIASFLSSVDNKLTLLTTKRDALIQYKKGVMQRIFNQEIRFKDEDESDYPDWEEKTLGEVGTFFSGGTPLTTKKSFYTGIIPFIKSGEISSLITNQFISEEALKESSAKMVETGDLLYALYGATSGEVAISKLAGAINQAVLCIRTRLDNIFLCNFLRMQKELILSTYLQGGQGNLSAEIVKSLVIPIPCFPEQTKIATFLTSLDDKINAMDQQIEKVKDWKKGLLQGMFV